MSSHEAHESAHHEWTPQAPADVTAELVATTSAKSGRFKTAVLFLGVVTIIGVVAMILKIAEFGDDPTRWGYVAALLSFILSSAMGAPMIGIAPVIAKANWVRPLTRLSAMASISGVAAILVMIPLLAQLPPLMVDGTRRRSLWFEAPNYSPHIWDLVALAGLMLTGLALFYASALPDFAAMRDHSTGWRQRLGRWLARGWVGTDVQWRTLRMRIGMFGTLYFLILVFVHIMISADFSMSLVPGWRDAIYPMYHAMNGLQAGVASAILIAWGVRRWLKTEKYIFQEQFWAMGRLLFALTLMWFYFWFSGFIVQWYGRTKADIMIIDLMVRGPMVWAFALTAAFAFIVPWWWLIWNRVRTSINGTAIGALIVLFGIMLDRVRIYVTTWSVDPSRIHEKVLTVLPGTTWPDAYDILIIIGGIAFTVMLIMLMTRIVPAVSIWEIQQYNLLAKPVKYLRTHGVMVAKPD